MEMESDNIFSLSEIQYLIHDLAKGRYIMTEVVAAFPVWHKGTSTIKLNFNDVNFSPVSVCVYAVRR